MAAKYKQGDTAYLIESNRIIREVSIMKAGGGFYTIRFKDSDGGIKVRENRLYQTKEEAEADIPKATVYKQRNPYDYM